MSITKINDEGSLAAWLSDKPDEWAQAVALRAALRALPHISYSSTYWLMNFALLPFRAVVTSWMQLTDPEIFERSEESRANSAFGGTKVDLAEYKSKPVAANAAEASYHSADAQSKSMWVKSDCVKAVGKAADAFRLADVADGPLDNEGDEAESAFWFSVRYDCKRLSDDAGPDQSKSIATSPMWAVRPIDWLPSWQKLVVQLTAINLNFSALIEWYERRIQGEQAAFEIPGDKGRLEDKAILLRLARATDEDFWDHGYEHVNEKLKGWLNEARARVAPQPAPLGTINSDPQDARSPQFGSDLTGRIAIKGDAGSDQLRSDPQSLSRHSRALQMAQKLGEALRNHNNAGYMTVMVDGYAAAMGVDQEVLDPSGLIFAGDQLRVAIAKHRAAKPTDDLQSLPPSADQDASAFLSAHNMYVGSDPFLDDLDRTTRGPDTPLPSANALEIKLVATAARLDDILAEPTYNYIMAAADVAPDTYNQADRHSRFAAGLAQNFARYGIEFLWAYPHETAWAGLFAGVGAAVMLGPLAAAGGTVAGIGIAYHLACNMIANEAVYRKWLATSPAGEDNFNRLISFLKSLPIKALKDD